MFAELTCTSLSTPPQHAPELFVIAAVFDVVRKLPDTGVQAKLQRKTWPPESFWTVTAVQPTVVRV